MLQTKWFLGTFVCASRTCRDFSVIFFTPSSTLISVKTFKWGLTIIYIHLYLSFPSHPCDDPCSPVIIHFSKMVTQGHKWSKSTYHPGSSDVIITLINRNFQTSCVSLVLLALGLCFSCITWWLPGWWSCWCWCWSCWWWLPRWWSTTGWSPLEELEKTISRAPGPQLEISNLEKNFPVAFFTFLIF